ncbi:MAG TPA: hypothetical protein VFA05_10300 [Gaiellaceae bacterium]|nr:hypothetical protein [Gaiellaceae bacterium]
MSSDAVIAEARAALAAGRTPNVESLRARLAGDPEGLRRLEQVLAVHRARARLRREAAPAPRASLRAALRTKPTISANMEVRREGHATIVWEPAPQVASWELRLSERPDPRSDYEEIETRALPPESTRAELPLSDRALKVHVLGRDRSGRLLRRAVVAGLTRAGWNDRWQRRASAS